MLLTTSADSAHGLKLPMLYIPTCVAIQVVRCPLDAVVSSASRRNRNTKSSTEAETVGASDYLLNTIWVKNFLDAQGYHLIENVLEQDNESTIKLEIIGRLSAGPRCRHIDIRYFWMKHRIATEGITICHCPALQMTADFFPIPLQGALFQKFRDVLMGHKRMDTLAIATLSDRTTVL